MTLKSLILLAMLLFVPAQLPALDAPPMTGRVNDLAQVMTPGFRQQLEQRLAAFERESSNQVAVLTVPSLQGDDIAPFAIRTAELWKIGQKGKDNGVLLVIAREERKVRIEVGMGLQGVLPDITTGRIIRDTMRPYLKAGNYEQGIAVGVDSIIAATKGEFKGDGSSGRKQPAVRSHPPFLTMLLGAIVAAAVFGLFSRYLGGAAGAVGLPLATYLAFPGMGLITLLLLAAGGLMAGIFLSMVASSMFGGGGGFGQAAAHAGLQGGQHRRAAGCF